MDITYYKKYEPIFGSWKIVREIGEGSFGKVFEIEREDFGRTYKAALKAITIPQSQSEVKSAMADGMDKDSVNTYFQGFVEEMVDEFALMSQLKGNSNIVSYEDHLVAQHKEDIGWDILIRMELLTPLIDYVQGRQLPINEVIKLGVDICKALEACRMCKTIHRDIKPENIFVSSFGDFKLGDFGIAKTVEKTTGGLSKKGTYTYMAPEVYKGEEYGPSVDIYSLGLVLYRYLNNNRAPFLPDYPKPIMHSDRESAMSRRIKGEPIPAPANADKRLADIILKACAYNPKDRYASPTEMREALEALLYGRAYAGARYASSEDITVEDTAVKETVKEQVEDKTVGIFSKKEDEAPVSEAKKEEESQPAIKAEVEAIAESDTYEPEEKTASLFSTSKESFKQAEKPQAVDAEKPDSKMAETFTSPANNSKTKKKWKIAEVVSLVITVLLILTIVLGIVETTGGKDIVAISAGAHHTVGLRSDGTVVATGDNTWDQCNVGSWKNIIAIRAGGEHTVGLKSDGTVVATGYNSYGECDVEDWTDIEAISAGASHTVGLRDDWTVVATGDNDSGQCDVEGWTDIVAISAGGHYTVGLKSDGTVVAVGGNDSGECDVEDWTDIVGICTYQDHTIGLKSDGTVVAVGRDNEGKCDIGWWTDIVEIGAGASHTVGLKSDGTVVAVGDNICDQCDVEDWTNIVAISTGFDYTLGLKSDGTVVATGDNSAGQCNVRKLNWKL